MSPRPSVAAPFSSAPFRQDGPPTASALPNQPHVYPPWRVLFSAGPPPDRRFPHSAGARIASPRRSIPPGAHPVPPLRQFPPFPLPTPCLSASCPSPARRVPQLHGLHGAAGSRPDPLTAPSSPGTSPSPPRRPSHTSAFRPHRKRRAARKWGGAARTQPGPRGAVPESRGARGAPRNPDCPSASSPLAVPSRCRAVRPGHWDSGHEAISTSAWPSFLGPRSWGFWRSAVDS